LVVIYPVPLFRRGKGGNSALMALVLRGIGAAINRLAIAATMMA
jgi:hypothetical protein